MSKWTKKGQPKEGYYFNGECPRCGKIQVAVIGDRNKPVCSICNTHQGVKITEKSK